MNALIKQSGNRFLGWLSPFQIADVHESEVLVRPIRTLCVLRTAKPERVAIDETAVKINGDWSWVYDAIGLDSRLILDVEVFGQRGTDLGAAFLHKLTEKHDLSETVFLVDGYGYLTLLSRLGLSGQLTYVDRNLIEQWLHTFKLRVDCFHNSWVGSRESVRE